MQAALSVMSLREFMDSRPKEVHAMIEARTILRQSEIEQAWDYTRHIMAASANAMGSKIRPSEILRLPRDGSHEPTQEQWDDYNEWAKKADAEMGITT